MRFYSKYKEYKIWLKPSYYRMNAQGDREFHQGVFAQFENGWFETYDEEVINLLKKNKYYGVDFWSVDEPAQPNPQGFQEEKIKEATKEETITDCPYCDKSFKNRAGLTSHIRIFHKNS